MPVLSILDSICLENAFYAAFCFLAQEEEDDYVWAMQQLCGLKMCCTRLVENPLHEVVRRSATRERRS